MKELNLADDKVQMPEDTEELSILKDRLYVITN